MKKILAWSILCILCLSMFGVLSPGAKATTLLSDSFTQDSSLNTQLWTVNGAIGNSAAQLIFCVGGSPVSPDLSFSTSDGMGVAGANSYYEFSTIVSQTSFAPPFTIQAVAMASSSYGNTFVLALMTADGSQGVSVLGNIQAGMALNTGPGSASPWNTQSLYSSPSLNVWYTITYTVGSSGSASVTLSSQGTTLATATVQIGTGPFYVLLGQGEGYPAVTGPNQAYWQSVTLTSGASSNSILYSIPITIVNDQSLPTASPFQQMIQIDSSQYSQYEASNLQNVEFLDGNGNVIPSWLESGNSNTATSTIYWVQLPSIPANSQMTIYMGFASQSVNLFNAQTTGEAPQLSPTYGQYDDGANVFIYYTNFAGNALPTGWAAFDPNLITYSVNNGLTEISAQNLGAYFSPQIYYTTSLSNPHSTVIDAYVNANSSSVCFGYLYGPNGWDQNCLISGDKNVWTVSSFNGDLGSDVSMGAGNIDSDWHVLSYFASTSAGNGWIDYGHFTTNSQYFNFVDSKPGLIPGTSGGRAQWFRQRALPPNDVMPEAVVSTTITFVSTNIPFWMQWWFWAIIALGAIVVILALATVHYRKRPSVSKETNVVQSKATQKAIKVCPKCGASLPADSKFCGKCGTSLE